jgi:hypothetical protein
MNERQLDDDWHSRLLREQFEQSRAKESAPTNGVEPKQHYVSIEAAVPSEPLQQTTLEEIEELTGDDYGQSFASHERRKTNAASSHSDGDRVEGDSATNLLGEEDDTQPSTPNQKSFSEGTSKVVFLQTHSTHQRRQGYSISRLDESRLARQTNLRTDQKPSRRHPAPGRPTPGLATACSLMLRHCGQRVILIFVCDTQPRLQFHRPQYLLHRM